jgi:hypothetical protein
MNMAYLLIEKDDGSNIELHGIVNRKWPVKSRMPTEFSVRLTRVVRTETDGTQTDITTYLTQREENRFTEVLQNALLADDLYERE